MAEVAVTQGLFTGRSLFSDGLLAALLLLISWPVWANLQLEPMLAWGGQMVSGQDTELGLQLISDRGEPIELELTATDFSLRYSGHLEPDIPLQLWLPVHPGPDGKLVIGLHGGDDRQLTREVHFQPQPHPFLVQIGSDHSSSLATSAQDLPRTTQGYEPVDNLILKRSILSDMDQQQAMALSRYLGDCGKLAVCGAEPRLLDGLRNMAGCGGRFIASCGKMISSGEMLSDPTPGITAERLEALRNGSGSSKPTVWLTIFFLVYILLLWALYRTLRYQAILLLAPLLTGIGLTVAGHALDPRSNILLLVETGSGTTQGRLTSLLTVVGSGLGSIQLPLVTDLKIPRPLGVQPIRLSQNQADPAHRSLHTQTHLFTSSSYAINGVVSLASKAIIHRSHTGVQLENQGVTKLPTGILAIGESLVATPPLAPGEHWSPSAHPPTVEWSAPTVLLRERVGSGTAWLLPLPRADSILFAGHDETDGWLLVHGSMETMQ